MTIHCFQSVNELVNRLCDEFLQFLTRNTAEQPAFIAISGGNTPKAFFEKLAQLQQPGLWNAVHFFWTDERCVPPEHPESNYGLAYTNLLSKIDIPEENIHRIYGEYDPFQESIRYAAEMKQFAGSSDGIPEFDWIFLGIGDDGHTASIFPDQIDLLKAENPCEVVIHPVTGQFRITITGKVILRAKRITFHVTGSPKSSVVDQIIHALPETSSYPAAKIHQQGKNIDWYIDKEAGKHLNIPCRG